MRNHLLACLFVFVFACSHGSSSEPIKSDGVPSRPNPTGTSSGSSKGDSPPIEVVGTVLNDDRSAISGRSIAVVDRRGKRFDVVTDSGGVFQVAGVAPPYDVLVAAAPSGAVVTPVAFLGITRRNPRLEVFEHDGPTSRPKSQTLRVGVRLPPCANSCWVSAASSSPFGAGGASASYEAGAASVILELDHGWTASSLPSSERIDVHVLVGDDAYGAFSYTQVNGVTADPGTTNDLGMLLPLPVDVRGPVEVSVQSGAVPAEWSVALLSWLDLPGGARMSFRAGTGPSLVTRLPLVPGATWGIGAWALHPEVENAPYYHFSLQGHSGALPLSGPQVTLEMRSAPSIVRPSMGGQLSRHAQGIAWTSADFSALATVVLVDTVQGRPLFRAMTNDAELTFARMQALGVSPPNPGDHVLDLRTNNGTTVDRWTEPDDETRDKQDKESASSSYQRFQFRVTP